MKRSNNNNSFSTEENSFQNKSGLANFLAFFGIKLKTTGYKPIATQNEKKSILKK